MPMRWRRFGNTMSAGMVFWSATSPVLQAAFAFWKECPHLQPLAGLLSDRPTRKRVRNLGELPDHLYRRELSGAEFLWHPTQVDNGTFSVVEAALKGVPSLSSRYPAMEEMDTALKLHLTWMDWSNPEDMARMLKEMELHAPAARESLPCPQDLSRILSRSVGDPILGAVRECL